MEYWCGLIIRLRKDIVGSTPTRPTKGFSDFGSPIFLLRKTGFAPQFLYLVGSTFSPQRFLT